MIEATHLPAIAELFREYDYIGNVLMSFSVHYHHSIYIF